MRSLAAAVRARHFFADNWIVIAGLAFVVLVLVSASIWDWDYWSELSFDESHKLNAIKTDRTRIVQQFLLTIGGIAAFVLATWRTWTAHKQANTALAQVSVALRQADLAERSHNVDRFAKGAAMLDSEKVTVRQAGVFALFDLGDADTRNSYILVIKLLGGFARARSIEFKKQPDRSHDETIEFADLHDAVRSVGWLRKQHPDQVDGERTTKFRLNMARIVAARIDLREVDFSLVNFRGADFTGSYMRSAKLWEADLRYGRLAGVEVDWTDFRQCFFQNGVLEGAEFNSCNFEDGIFAEADLSSTKFVDCNISRANFEGCSGLTSESIEEAWAWKDSPPRLPEDVSFERLYDPGANDAIRQLYESSRTYRRGFSAPNQ
jgi:uncharacterized protein YjbI with pentapeptide repeats